MASAMDSCFSATGSLKVHKSGASNLLMAYAHTAHANMPADTRAREV